MKKLLLLISCFSMSILCSYGQKDTAKAYPRGSLYLGLNSGLAWQKGDIRSRLGIGWGVTLEKILTRTKSPYLGWAMRGRYLHSNTWGRDKIPFYGITTNPAISGSYDNNLNYTSAGYIYPNYASSINELALELKVFFNRAWHRSGVSPYFFGGIGMLGYSTKIDQLDYDGSMYDYSSISTMQGLASWDLKRLLDHDYESPAENVKQPHWVVTPGFGGGLAIRLGYGASLGLEHKISLPASDLLDGQRWNRAGKLDSKNDIHHYSNFWVNFRIFGRPVNTTHQAAKPVLYKPILTIVRSEVIDPCMAGIEIQTRYVTSVSQIQITVNGNYVSQNNFSFNTSSGTILIEKKIEGYSNFTIQVTTAGGTTKESIHLNCSTPIVPVPAPAVTVLQPTSTVSQNCTVYIKAQLRHIESQDQIIVLENQHPVNPSDYSFNSGTGILEIRNQLRSHTEYLIKVRNQTGEASATVGFTCNSVSNVKPMIPEIIVLNPASNPYTAPSCEYIMKIELKHITSKNQIKISVDGMPVGSMMYKYNPESRLLSLALPLTSTPMEVVVTATNQGGSVSRTQIISCNTPGLPPPVEPGPVIDLINPSIPQIETSSCPYKISVRIENVSYKNQIRILRNAQAIPAESWQWDANNHIAFWYTDNNETNTYLILAQNNAGKAQQKITINCIQKIEIPIVLPPAVIVTSPVTNPYETPQCNYLLKAEIQNIIRKDQLQLFVNNQFLNPSLYSFDPTTHLLSVQVTIPETGASIRILATNESGTDQKVQQLNCKPVVVQSPPPVITLIDPSAPQIETTNCPYKIIAKIDNVSSKNQIQIFLNGQIFSSANWQWDPNRRIASWNSPGIAINNYLIIAQNSGGKVQQNLTVNCIEKIVVPAVLPPIVIITSPVSNPYEALQCNYQLKAEIRNIVRKDQLSVFVNNQFMNPSLYSFDPVTQLLSAAINIPESGAAVRISATNESGTDQKIQQLNCKPVVVISPPPVISLINPSSPQIETTNCPYKVSTKIDNITSKEQIHIFINGQPLTSYLWQWDAGSHLLTWNSGSGNVNSYRIVAENNGGKVQKEITVNCIEKVVVPTVLPPVITITLPATNPFESPTCEYLFKAEIQNIVRKDQLQVFVNNQFQQPSLYSFNEPLHLLSMQVMIPEKGASILIVATNESGTDQKLQQLDCPPPVVQSPPPVISLIDPSSPQIETYTCPYNVSVKIDNVTSKEQIQILINGQALSASQWQWNPNNHTATWNTGSNPINHYKIVAENNGGKTNQEITVNCIVKIQVPPPTVNITTPRGNPFVSVDCKENIQAKVSNIERVDQINVRIGNLPLLHFSFDPSLGIIHFPIAITDTAAITISVANEGGTASDELTVICKPIIVDNKIIICHHVPGSAGYPQTIEILESTWPTHQAHGDTKGECPVREEKKSTICHYTPGSVDPQTIEISESEWATHQAHGDIRGECPVKEEKKITICHYPPGNTDNPQTIEVSENAWPAHQAHGDLMGTCPVIPVLPPPVVSITNPSTSPYSTRDCNQQVIADVQNIEEKNQITVTVNNRPETNFSFSNGKVTVPVKADGATQVVIAATNKNGNAQDNVTIKCEEDFGFQIDTGAVVPNKKYCAEIKVIGCALKVGGNGEDLPIMVRVNLGNQKLDAFGTYTAFNIGSNVNDRKTHTWRSENPIPENTAISITAKSFMPGKTQPIYERNSQKDGVMVKVLRNNSPIPSITGFNGQADAESYLKPYIINNKIRLEENQALYLFELGTGSTSSSAYDLQDCVIIVTLSESCQFTGSTEPVEYAPAPEQKKEEKENNENNDQNNKGQRPGDRER